MALLFMDSFDHYVTADLTEKWAGAAGSPSPVISAGNGRRSTASLRVTSQDFNPAYATTTPSTTGDAIAVWGCALRLVALPTASNTPVLFSLRESATVQVSVVVQSDGKLVVKRGTISGTVLGTTSSGLSAGTFVFVECKILIHPSAGTVDVRFNGVSVLALTAQNTRNTATATWTALMLGCPDAATVGITVADYDDLYLLDGTGAAPWNTFLGDCRVDVRLPTAAGATTGWTPLAGANWQNVDDAAPDDDTTYNSTSTVGATDTFTVQDAPVAGATLYGVQHCLSLKKMDAGACTIAPVVRHSSTDYAGTAIAPTTAYAYGRVINQTNPGTAAQWTEAGFNAAEFGYTRVS
jgi:hypothetical protein